MFRRSNAKRSLRIQLRRISMTMVLTLDLTYVGILALAKRIGRTTGCWLV